MMQLNVHDLTSLLDAYGYWAVLLFVGVESIGVPVPGETMLLVASIYAGTTHRLGIVPVILAAIAGAVLGDNIGFVVGRQGGYRLLHRHGHYLHLDDRKLRLGRYLFERHGGKAVFFGRFVPFLRIWAAFLAGTHGMSWTRFVAYNAGGGLIWASVMGSGAYIMGNSMHRLGGWMEAVSLAVAGAAMLAVVIGWRRSEQRLQYEADCTSSYPELRAC